MMIPIPGILTNVRAISREKIYMLRMSNAIPNWLRNALMFTLVGSVVCICFWVYQLKAFSEGINVGQQNRVIEERVHLLLVRGENSERGYLLTGNNEYLNDYHSSIEQLHANFRALDVYLRFDNIQASTLVELNAAISVKLNDMEKNISLYESGDHVQLRHILSSDKGLDDMHKIEDLLNTLIAQQTYRLRQMRGRP